MEINRDINQKLIFLPLCCRNLFELFQFTFDSRELVIVVAALFGEFELFDCAAQIAVQDAVVGECVVLFLLLA